MNFTIIKIKTIVSCETLCLFTIILLRMTSHVMLAPTATDDVSSTLDSCVVIMGLFSIVTLILDKQSQSVGSSHC